MPNTPKKVLVNGIGPIVIANYRCHSERSEESGFFVVLPRKDSSE